MTGVLIGTGGCRALSELICSEKTNGLPSGVSPQVRHRSDLAVGESAPRAAWAVMRALRPPPHDVVDERALRKASSRGARDVTL